MLEIIALIVGSCKIHQVAKSRGLTSGPLIALFIVMWFGGEFIGAVLGELKLVDFIDPEYGSHWKAYLFALLSAVIIGGVGFGLGVCLPVAIGRHPTEDQFGRPGEMLDPDLSFDLSARPARRNNVPGDESASRKPQTDTDQHNDLGFRRHPDC